MQIERTSIEDVKILRPHRQRDERGFFSEVYSADVMRRAGLPDNWIQDNESRSFRRGTIRGLHFQKAPQAQAKLVRVTRGSIVDIAVDIRHGSSTFAKHVSIELNEQDLAMLYVPVGFAHGFCTLTDETEVQYKVNAPYDRLNETGIIWNDPDLGISWPLQNETPILSEKDRSLPPLKELQPFFWQD